MSTIIPTSELGYYLDITSGVNPNFTKELVKSSTEYQEIKLSIKDKDVIKCEGITGDSIKDTAINTDGTMSFKVLRDKSKNVVVNLKRQMTNYSLMMFIVDVSNSMNVMEDYYRIQAEVCDTIKRRFNGTDGYLKSKYILAKVFYTNNKLDDCGSFSYSGTGSAIKFYSDIDSASTVTLSSGSNSLLNPWIRIQYSDYTQPDVFSPFNKYSFPTVDNNALLVSRQLKYKHPAEKTYTLDNCTITWTPKYSEGYIFIENTTSNYIATYYKGEFVITTRNGKKINRIDYFGFNQTAPEVLVDGTKVTRTSYASDKKSMGQIVPSYLSSTFRMEYNKDFFDDSYQFIHDVPFMNQTTENADENMVSAVDGIKNFIDVVDDLDDVECYDNDLNGKTVSRHIVVLSDELYKDDKHADKIKEKYGTPPKITSDSGVQWNIDLPDITSSHMLFVVLHKAIKDGSGNITNYKPIMATKIQGTVPDGTKVTSTTRFSYSYTFPKVNNTTKTFHHFRTMKGTVTLKDAQKNINSGVSLSLEETDNIIMLHYYYE